MQYATIEKFRVTVSFLNGSNSVVDENHFQCLIEADWENLKCQKIVCAYTKKAGGFKKPKI